MLQIAIAFAAHYIATHLYGQDKPEQREAAAAEISAALGAIAVKHVGASS